MAKKKKIFILDTNVLLHDYNSLYNFQENDIIIPIVVLEELDKFKKGNNLINFHAREFTRELDKLSEDQLFADGISLGKNRGTLFIETGKEFSKIVSESFPEKTPDHRILAIAEFIHVKNPEKNVALITKDINLRMKAKSLGIQAQDYETDKVANIEGALDSNAVLYVQAPEEQVAAVGRDVARHEHGEVADQHVAAGEAHTESDPIPQSQFAAGDAGALGEDEGEAGQDRGEDGGAVRDDVDPKRR